MGQEAEQIRQSLQSLNRSPGDSKRGLPVGIIATNIRLGIIKGLLGHTDEIRRRFYMALQWERRYTSELMSHQPGGEDAFASSRLEKRWVARDAALSVTDSTVSFYDEDIYQCVWETKGHSTRSLERTYAAMRRVALMEAKSDILPISNRHFAELRTRMDVRRQIVQLLLEPSRDPGTRDSRMAELVNLKCRLMGENVDSLSLTWTPDEIKAVYRTPPVELRRYLGKTRVFVDFLRYLRIELDPSRVGGHVMSQITSHLLFLVSG